MKHFHSLRALIVVTVSIAVSAFAFAGNGDNSTPGGCSDTYYGCNEQGEQHDPNDPNSVFSYEQSCVWCVSDRDREIAAVLYGELGYVPEEPLDLVDFDLNLCEWDFKVAGIDFCNGRITIGVGPGSVCIGNCEDDDSITD